MTEEPELLPSSVVPGWTPSAPPTGDPARPSPVYFARNDRLVAVERGLSGNAPVANAVAAVVSGPTDRETQAGLRTALPADLSPEVTTSDDTTVISLRPGALDVPAGEQVVAVAQLVWTATAPPGAAPRVELRVGEKTLPVPVDGGRLENRPVTRADYRSVAPR
ncbi:GerMN domain-containing protein [Cryptosporangium japonicum]|uniref:GerMN domain-containing protein n=1 Tax=Cryptosporangium japonicum TaxID=80872 RepID=UPI0031DAA30C